MQLRRDGVEQAVEAAAWPPEQLRGRQAAHQGEQRNPGETFKAANIQNVADGHQAVDVDDDGVCTGEVGAVRGAVQPGQQADHLQPVSQPAEEEAEGGRPQARPLSGEMKA